MEQRQLIDPATLIPGLDGHTVGNFWQWAFSDILMNVTRSTFAEYIVGVALGVVETPRVEWDAADLLYEDRRIEVKSSAYCQSWHQEKPSTIKFSISRATVWDPAKAKYEGPKTRCADVYVFCLYPEQDKTKANVLDVPAWDFYVVPTETLNWEFGAAKSLSLAAVKRVGTRCKFDGLRATVEGVLRGSS